jgi:hypothetical protein
MIEKIGKQINWLYNNLERWLFYGLILLTGIAGTWFTYNYAVAFSDYFIVLLFVTIFFAIFDWFDTYILKTINTIDEIKKGNTAVSQFLLAIAVLVLAAAITVG